MNSSDADVSFKRRYAAESHTSMIADKAFVTGVNDKVSDGDERYERMLQLPTQTHVVIVVKLSAHEDAHVVVET